MMNETEKGFSVKSRLKKYLKRLCILVIVVLAILTVGPKVVRFYYAKEAAAYLKENQNVVSEGRCHFSIDDTILIFEDLTEHRESYNSIFDNETLSYLKYLHETYGVVFSMYCFYEDEDFKLSQATDYFAAEFAENSSWLKFGFHGKNYSTLYNETDAETAAEDYNAVITELIRICGGENCITKVVRLSGFQGNTESILAMAEQTDGIQGLLTADDDRGSYCLTEKQEKEVQQDTDIIVDDMEYYATDFRIENIDDINAIETKHANDPLWVVFTHEYYLDSNKYQWELEKVLLYLIKQNYTFTYLADE